MRGNLGGESTKHCGQQKQKRIDNQYPLKSISFREAIQGAVRLTAGHRNKPEKWRVAEIMKKVRNFFRKPLDKSLKV